MSNPEIRQLDKKDKYLGISGLKRAGLAYAAELNPKDFRVSPIYGDFSDLGQISVFIGTHDLFFADSKKLRDELRRQGIPINFFEYPKMFHVWVAVTTLPEARHAIDQISKLISEGLREI